MTNYLNLAAVLLGIASFTNVSPWHPDEWYQTVEFAHGVAFGVQSMTQEVTLHLRNLTWPALLVPGLQLAHLLAPDYPLAVMIAVKWTTVAFHLLGLWAISLLIEMQFENRTKDRAFRAAAYALFVLPWFWLSEGVRPSGEHLSAIAFWISLSGIERAFREDGPHRQSPEYRWAMWAGFWAVMTAAFRYPSGILGFGILLVGFLRLRSKASRRALLIGTVVGLMAGGLADWIIYGRPWESAWMYLQYNVLTGTSALRFGSQTILEYWGYFRGQFGGVLMPLGILAIVLLPYGVWRGLKKSELWSDCFLLYFSAHLLVEHKEPRFMAPILGLVIWGALIGAHELRPHLQEFRDRIKHSRLARIFPVLFLILFLANLAWVGRTLWGETWKAGTNMLAIGPLLSQDPNACAVLRMQPTPSSLVPWAQSERNPSIPFGAIAFKKGVPAAQTFLRDSITWTENLPTCAAHQSVWVQPAWAERAWVDKLHCEIAPVGPARWLSPERFAIWVDRGWVSAPWYRCPSTVLAEIKAVPGRRGLAHQIPRLTALPPVGLDSAHFLEFVRSHLVPQDPLYLEAALSQ